MRLLTLVDGASRTAARGLVGLGAFFVTIPGDLFLEVMDQASFRLNRKPAPARPEPIPLAEAPL
jgi:hypothetical protein